ncbi:MAG TPA: 60S ribosomal export protein NMD3 [Natrialbaceae archaeon]|nr:60S ribosomal export protein NMD3 [Natrialbaceae archaeon]
MTNSRRFCPRCGDPIEPRGADDALDPLGESGVDLCDDCYFEQFDLVDAPDRIEVRVCSQCGAIHRGNRWVDVGARDYTDVAIEEVSEALAVHVDAEDVTWEVAPEQVDQNTIRMHAHFSGIVRGTLREESVVVPVKISRETCTRCGRIAGDYYASIVQIRAQDRDTTPKERERAEEIANEVVAEMEATGDREAFVTEVGEVDDGLDIKLSTNSIGKQVANRMVREFGGSVSDSETLVTEDEDGNEVYRVTYAVRLPPYRPGDVISLADDDGPVLVTSVRGNLKGRRVTTGEAFEASYEDGDAPDARVLGRTEDGEETPLVSVEDDNAVQVLDPETYESKTVARPDYLDPDAEAVTVLKHREGLHVLPEDANGDANDE